MSGTQCIIIILLVRIIQHYSNKSSSMLVPNTLYGNAKYFMLTKLFAVVFACILLLLGREWERVNLSTLIISGISGLMLVVSSACGLYAIKSGTMALSSIFSTAGLIVPCVAGIFLYDEVMSVMQWVGIVLFLGSSCLLISATKQINTGFSLKTILLLLGNLVSNGVTMLLQTVFSREVENGSVSVFSFFSFLIPTLFLLFFLGGYRLKAPESCHEKLPKKLVALGIVSAFVLFVINQLATVAAAQVEPVILFTFINGGSTIIAAVMGAVFFKEKFTLKSALGILIGLGALIIVKAF